MWKLIPFLVFLACLGCTGPRYQEPYVLSEIKATLPLAAGEQLLFFERVDADVYWVPFQDVTRLKYKEFFVETILRDAAGKERVLSRVDLLGNPEIGRDGNPPSFRGACDAGSFWLVKPYRLFFVEANTGKTKQLPAAPEALMFSNWARTSPRSVRITNEYGVFEFTPEGAKQIAGEPLP
jgi:hypothetical protein